MKKIMYVDMDGVIADFDHAIKSYNQMIDSKIEDEINGDLVDKICEANSQIFHTLKPIKGGVEAVKKLADHYEIYFLSTPMWNVPESFTGKRIWIHDHFGDWAKKRLILTHRKDLNLGAYLIDDRLKNGVEGFNGVHIHFGSARFPDWNSVVKHLLPIE